ncbi:D-alanyl-D-alanine carboxypeptidase/D-alanyl-D-alanine-endopeptidase [Deinococcus altitudinis]|uniref:D-alanyl-D-alanine carboxypeptidase/D-alanyl-D-alanine-endopeptidase n=1 Tax=Deinococcus altitudinis TaxID=468914 RepID=UPI0038918EB4
MTRPLTPLLKRRPTKSAYRPVGPALRLLALVALGGGVAVCGFSAGSASSAAAPSGRPPSAGTPTSGSVTLPVLPATALTPSQLAGLNAVLRRATGFRLGVLVSDADSGQSLYARQPDSLFTPASNMKLLSLSAALYGLGPDYWFSTTVTRPAVARPAGGAQAARADHLTLVGSGDPSLGAAGGEHSLSGLARQVYASGVRTVGALRLDSRLIGAAAGTGQAGWQVPVVERPVIGLTLNDPSAGDGAELTTTPNARAALETLGDRFRTELERAGVRVGSGLEVVPLAVGEQGRGQPEEGIATTRSAPLASLVQEALKRSDNVWTEQLYARLGVDSGTPVWRPASLVHARAQELALLERAGASGSGLVLADGSGLSEQGRLTPRALALLLRYLYLHPATVNPATVNPATLHPATGALTPQAAFVQRRNLLIEALPRAGTGTATRAAVLLGGTLATRLNGLDVRAKTGTLPGVSALSGYLTTATGRVLIFSVLMDGYGGPGQDLRRIQDALLRALAADT